MLISLDRNYIKQIEISHIITDILEIQPCNQCIAKTTSKNNNGAI